MARLPDTTPSRKEQIQFLLDFRYGPQGKLSKEEIEAVRAKVLRGQTITLAELTSLPEEYTKSLNAESKESLKRSYWKAFDEKQELEALRLDFQKQRQVEEARRNRDPLRDNPGLTADFDYWSKHPYWEIDEAIALSLGLDPNRVSWRFAEQKIPVSDLARHFRDRRLIAQRARHVAKLPSNPSPTVWLNWFQSHELSVAEDLCSKISARSALYFQTGTHGNTAIDEIAELKAKIIELEKHIADAKKDISGKAKTSLLKLILGMALDGYRYEPKATRSDVILEICKGIAEFGITLDENTVRTYLREAASEIEFTSRNKEG